MQQLPAGNKRSAARQNDVDRTSGVGGTIEGASERRQKRVMMNGGRARGHQRVRERSEYVRAKNRKK